MARHTAQFRIWMPTILYVLGFALVSLIANTRGWKFPYGIGLWLFLCGFITAVLLLVLSAVASMRHSARGPNAQDWRREF